MNLFFISEACALKPNTNIVDIKVNFFTINNYNNYQTNKRDI